MNYPIKDIETPKTLNQKSFDIGLSCESGMRIAGIRGEDAIMEYFLLNTVYNYKTVMTYFKYLCNRMAFFSLMK